MTFGGFGGGNQVRVTVIGDASQLKREMGEARRDVDQFAGQSEGRLGRFSGAVKGALVAGAGAAVATFAKDAIDSFSNLEQSVGGTEAVFGDARTAIDEFAAKSAEAIGLSESEFRTATTQIGGQLKRMGLDVDTAAQKSIDLTGVAADLAATYGGTTAEAVGALGAAFRGEADPAERFNLNLKIGAQNAKAVELGLADSTSEVSEHARAQATLALIMEQSSDAQGQFAREQDTIAGSTQIMAAKFEDLKAKLGGFLAGSAGDLIDWATDTITVFDKLADAMPGSDGEGGFLDFIKQIDPFSRAGEMIFDAWGGVADLLSGAGDEAESSAPRFSNLGGEVDYTAQAAERARDAMYDTRDAAMRSRPEVRNLRGEQARLGRAFDETTEAMQDQYDEMRAQIDPLFKLRRANQDVREAQQRVADALDEFGRDSPEYAQAVSDLAEANLDLEGAQLDARDASQLTRDEFINQQTELGLTREDAELLADEFERLDDFQFKPKTIEIDVNTDLSDLPKEIRAEFGSAGRARGGPVSRGQMYTVGEEGRELFVPSEDGQIVPASDTDRIISAIKGLGGTSGGGDIVIQVDGREIARAVRNHDRRYR